MTNDDEQGERAANLRERAEKNARARGIPPLEEIEATPREVLQQMIHELHVHEFELTMQNDELRRVQTELDAVRARYFDIYNLAPVGYFIVSLDGRILEANLTAATMLATARGALVTQPIHRFIFKDDQDIYYRHRLILHRTGKPHQCELRMVRSDGTTFWVLLTATSAQDLSTTLGPDGSDGSDPAEAAVTRVVLSDITERKRVEEEKIALEAQLEEARKPRTSSATATSESAGHPDGSDGGAVQ